MSPAIFYSHDPFAKYLVKSMHEGPLDHTGGVQTLTTHVNKIIWIIGGSTLIKNTLERCPWCLKRKIENEQLRQMPSLHITRLPPPEEKNHLTYTRSMQYMRLTSKFTCKSIFHWVLS